MDFVKVTIGHNFGFILSFTQPLNASQSVSFYIVVIVFVCFIFDIARSSHVFNSHNQCTMWMSPRELNSVKTVNRPVTF